MKKLQHSVGAVTSIIRNNEVDFFASLANVLSDAVSDKVYVVAGNAKPGDYGTAHTYPIKYGHGTNLISNILRYILHQFEVIFFRLFVKNKSINSKGIKLIS